MFTQQLYDPTSHLQPQRLTIHTMNDAELFYFRELYLIDPDRIHVPMERSSLSTQFQFKRNGSNSSLNSLELEMSLAEFSFGKSRNVYRFDTDYDLPVHGDFSIVIGDGWPSCVDVNHNRVFGFRTTRECLYKLRNIKTFTRCTIFLQRSLYDKRKTPHDHYFEYFDNEKDWDEDHYETEKKNLEMLIDLLKVASDEGLILLVQFPLEQDDRRQLFSQNNIRRLCSCYINIAHMSKFIYGTKGEITNQSEIDRNMKQAIKTALTVSVKTIKHMATSLAGVIREYGSKEHFLRRLRHRRETVDSLITPRVMRVQPPEEAENTIKPVQPKPEVIPTSQYYEPTGSTVSPPPPPPPDQYPLSSPPQLSYYGSIISPCASDNSNSSRKRRPSDDVPLTVLTFGSNNWQENKHPRKDEGRQRLRERHNNPTCTHSQYQPYHQPRDPYQPPLVNSSTWRTNPSSSRYQTPYMHQVSQRLYTEIPITRPSIPSLYPPPKTYQSTQPAFHVYQHINPSFYYTEPSTINYPIQNKYNSVPIHHNSQSYQNMESLISLTPPPPPPTPPAEKKCKIVSDMDSLSGVTLTGGHGMFQRPKPASSRTYKTFRHQSAFHQP